MKPSLLKLIILLKRDKRGTALIEMSLLLPIIVLLMGGMAEFGRALQQHHVASKGVKSAARYLARVPGNRSCTQANWDSYLTQAKSIAQRGSLDGSAPLVIPNWDASATFTVTVTCIPNAPDAITGIRPYRDQENMPILTVSTSFNFDDFGMLGLLEVTGLSALTITTSHQQMYIGG